MLKMVKIKYGVVWCSVGQCGVVLGSVVQCWVYLRLIIGLSYAEQEKCDFFRDKRVEIRELTVDIEFLHSYIPT